MTERLLVIIAHSDDEVLGAGGTIARYAANGCPCYIRALGDGETSRKGADKHSIIKRTVAFSNAGSALGVSSTSMATTLLPDNQFDMVPLLAICQTIEQWISDVSPTIILTHSSADINIDHRRVFQAVLTATRPQPGENVREVYAFETPSSTEWAFGQFGAFQPNVFVDITETMEVKLRALECYESEMRPYPHPRSPEAIRAIARRWGSVVGCEYAEAFQLIRSLR